MHEVICAWQRSTNSGMVKIVRIYRQSAAKHLSRCAVQRLNVGGLYLKSLRYSPGLYESTRDTCIYRRHTNFAMESIEQTFNGQATWGKKVTCTVSRNGDLIHRMYLRVKLPAVTVGSGSFRWLNWVGHVLLKSVEIEIGGQRIKDQIFSAEKYQALMACAA